MKTIHSSRSILATILWKVLTLLNALLLGTGLLFLVGLTAYAGDPFEIINTNESELIPIEFDSEADKKFGTEFSDVVNFDSVTKNYRLTNNSGGTLKITGLVSTSGDFVTSPANPSLIIPANGTFNFSITFNARVGREVAQIKLSTDAAGSFGAFTFLVAGTGIPRNLYVDASASGANNGSSWANAFVELQNALAIANGGDRIRIATGVYYPDQGIGQTNNDRESTFRLVAGARVTGGYPAGGGAYDPEANPTVLSGDLQQNDSNLDGNNIAESYLQTGGLNAYRVVTLQSGSETFRLTGVTVTAGVADGSIPEHTKGGGIHSSNPETHLILADSKLMGNKAGSLDGSGTGVGAGIYFTSNGGELQLDDCIVSGNATYNGTSRSTGAGMFVQGACLRMTRCLLENNRGVGTIDRVECQGTAIGIQGGQSGTDTCSLTDVVIRNHDSTGGISTSDTTTFYASLLDSIQMTRCQISGNEQTTDPSSVCIITRNIESITVRDSLFTGNKYPSFLWAWRGSGGVNATFLNTTVAANSGGDFFAIDVGGPASGIVSFANCVSDIGLWTQGIGTLSVFRNNSIIKGFPADGNGNLPDTTDPLFVDPRPSSEAPTIAGDYRLLTTSPLVDSGSAAATTSTLDVLGEPRVQDSNNDGMTAINIGAHETTAVFANGPNMLFVDESASGVNNGGTWEHAFLELQDALAIATEGDEIHIATGVYYPDQGVGQVNNDRASTFQLVAGTTITGGYPAGGGPNNPEANPTVLSGDLQQDDSNLDGNNISESHLQIGGLNALHVVSLQPGTETTRLVGVTVTGGSADIINTGDDGGGIHCDTPDAHFILTNCRLVGNRAGALDIVNGRGAGLYFESLGGELEIENCEISGNAAYKGLTSGAGGGILVSRADLKMTRCLLEKNEIIGDSLRDDGQEKTADGFAIRALNASTCSLTEVIIRNHDVTGGFHRSSSIVSLIGFASFEMARCQFSGNKDNAQSILNPGIRTGGIDSVIVRDCLFTGNRFNSSVWTSFDDPPNFTFINTTVAGNAAPSFLLITDDNGVLSFGNCVFEQGVSTPGLDNLAIFRSHSLIEGFPADGDGNLDGNTDPVFTDPRPLAEAPTTAGDYRLRPDSPLVDAGSDSASTSTLDVSGEPRVQDGDEDGTSTINIGAHEMEFGIVPPSGVAVITDIEPNDSTVILTLESTVASTYKIEFTADLTAGTWTLLNSGSLNAGLSTIPFSHNSLGGQPQTFFRVVTP